MQVLVQEMPAAVVQEVIEQTGLLQQQVVFQFQQHHILFQQVAAVQVVLLVVMVVMVQVLHFHQFLHLEEVMEQKVLLQVIQVVPAVAAVTIIKAAVQETKADILHQKEQVVVQVVQAQTLEAEAAVLLKQVQMHNLPLQETGARVVMVHQTQ